VAPDGVQPDIEVTVPDGTPPERDLYLERAAEFLTQRNVGGGAAQPAPSVLPSVVGGSSRLTPATAPIGYDNSGVTVAAF
jgi:hypothetical protein